ncbi:protein of unknown function DUF214 [Coriobacterium glomerans PW2]|uniref:ABC3 transporter permease C-terminal domain-containing protein n=1 Tax=Coriobacterium glomerans (strain ATCC 49209 / DSM 20642 / JCM 10262 / PW2) TaxID=700015 RepID=F2N9U1_CORGP|nr:ABC transporter permease [Coriobacterium glomerans]AEB07194.1 protein of unknown function DUF214 [Coriobacterium glomerans PW2]
MGIFGRFALRSLRRNRVRTITSIVGVALSCAAITAIVTTAFCIRSALIDATARHEGTWQIVFRSLRDADLASLRRDPHVAHVSQQGEYGLAVTSRPQSAGFQRRAKPNSNSGEYLSLLSVSDANDRLSPRPDLESGRYPEKPHEIIVPNALLGMRVPALDDAPGMEDSVSIALGSVLRLQIGSRAAGANAARDDRSELSDVSDSGPLTVVGVYIADGGEAAQGGYDVFTGAGGGAAPRAFSAWITTTGLDTYEDVQRFADAFVRKSGAGARRMSTRALDRPVALHDSLLELEFNTPFSSLWTRLLIAAALLCAIVMVASSVFIFTSLAISVSERTKQFALLASLGASKRQLRRVVLAEALALTLIGVPVGVALGLLGAKMALSAGKAGMSVLFQAELNGASFSIQPVAIGLAALASLIAVALGAALPAWRACRVSPVDAVRGVRVRRKRRSARRGRVRGQAAVSRCDRVRLRIGGVPGLLAQRNRRRTGSHARVATAALTVSVAVLVVSAWLSSFMNDVLRASSRTRDGDIVLSVEQTDRVGESLETMLAELDGLQREAAGTAGVRSRGTDTIIQLNAHVDAEMLQPDVWRDAAARSPYPQVNLNFMDDAAWRRYLDALGLSVGDYCNPECPLAIALNTRLVVCDANSFAYRPVFRHTGAIDLVTRVRAHRDGLDYQGLRGDGAGGCDAVYGAADGGRTELTPSGHAILSSTPIKIAALSERAPDALASLGSSSAIEILLPLSSLPKIAASARHTSDDSADDVTSEPSALSAGALDPAPFGDETGFKRTLKTSCSFQSADAAKTERSLREIIERAGYVDAGFSFSIVNNAKVNQEGRIGLAAAQVLATSFSMLTALIAVANVFTAMSASIVLRRREFAVLRSLGMDGRMFRAMIARECATCAFRALTAGLMIATGLCYLIFWGVQPALLQLTFSLPSLFSIGQACSIVFCVTLVSVVYALRRCRSDAPVETLRDEVL